MATMGTLSRTPDVRETFVFPDPPDDPEAKMTSFDHLTITGSAHSLAVHLGKRDTTLVAGDRYMSPAIIRDVAGLRNPDLLVAFGVDPAAYRRRNAYVISEQGKPLDFVLEVASKSTGGVDTTDKRVDYARLGIREYWRFDETGEYHGARLAGDQLVEGRYAPIPLENMPGRVLQGYSRVLDIYLRWEDGELLFCDPATGFPIACLEDEREARMAAEANAEAEKTRADSAQARAEAAEARVLELEERIRRLED